MRSRLAAGRSTDTPDQDPRYQQFIRTVPALRQPWVAFRWLVDPPTLDAATLARLDEAWAGLGLTGAVLVHPVTDNLAGLVRLHACHDDDLTLNVLLRARGGLVLAAMPLLDDPAALDGLHLATDDPRLTALVVVEDGGR